MAKAFKRRVAFVVQDWPHDVERSPETRPCRRGGGALFARLRLKSFLRSVGRRLLQEVEKTHPLLIWLIGGSLYNINLPDQKLASSVALEFPGGLGATRRGNWQRRCRCSTRCRHGAFERRMVL